MIWENMLLRKFSLACISLQLIRFQVLCIRATAIKSTYNECRSEGIINHTEFCSALLLETGTQLPHIPLLTWPLLDPCSLTRSLAHNKTERRPLQLGQ
jgi:hypothetical protein